MTLESVKDLGDVELRLQLAEATGWTNILIPQVGEPIGFRNGNSDGYAKAIPNFIIDLNPLHQIEITRFKTETEKHMYYEKLTTVCRGTNYSPFSAPARLRAEAILLTLGGGHE